MLHRDLKPSNVRVTESGRVVILDFGLAAELDSAGRHESTDTNVLGTAAYMAPEQAAGLPVSPAADWYSVGVMLYQALTGRIPFGGDSLDVLAAKQRAEPPPPRDLAPGLPTDLDTLCVDLLRRNPEARPPGREVLDRLGSGAEKPEPAGQPRPGGAPLVGRERHLAVLERAFAAMQGGQAAALFIQGSSGTGKTALVQRFLDRVFERDRAVVLTGRCYEQESVPFKALDGLIDSLSHYLKRLSDLEARALLPRDVLSLARVFPVLRRVQSVAASPLRPTATQDPRELRQRAFVALRELLARLGDCRPLILFIDDLQWGDIDSAALLTEILRPPEPPVLLLLGCHRGEDVGTSPFLRTLLSPQGAASGVARSELEVEPLTPKEAEELALELLGGRPTDALAFAKIIAQESQGSPFFVHELVQNAGHLDRLSAAGGGVLDDVLWSRIERLSEGARRLLEVVAVSGRPVGWAEACRAAGLEAHEGNALAVLRSGRLVRSAGAQEDGQVEVYHDRVREVVAARLSPAVLKEHHHQLALQLQDSGRADLEVLAIHFHEAGENERAGVYYAVAAERAAASLAFDRAAKLYRLALELRTAGSQDEYRLRARLGDALANARRGREAGQVYLDASPGVSRLESIDLRRRAFQQLLTSGEHDRGLEVLRDVFHEVGLSYAKSPTRALAMTAVDAIRLSIRGVGFRPRPLEAIADEEISRLDVGWSAGMGLCLIDTARSAQILFDNLIRSLRAGDVLHVSQAMLAVSVLMAVSGPAGMPFSRRLMRTAERLMGRIDDPTVVALHFMAKGFVAHCQGNWADALAFNDRGAAIFREQCTGVATSLDISAHFSLLALFWLGEFEELRRRRRALLQEAEQRQDLFSMTNYRTEVMSYDLLAADDPTGAAHEVDDAIRQWSQSGFQVQHLFALVANVRIDLYRGMGAEAHGRIGAAWSAYRQSRLDRSCIARVNVNQLIACSAVASCVNRPGASSLLREAAAAARRLERERVPYASALASMFKGRIASMRGHQNSAVTSYKHAAGAFRTLRMPLYEAATLFRLGDLLPTDERASLVRQSTDWLASQEVREPISLVRMILP